MHTSTPKPSHRALFAALALLSMGAPAAAQQQIVGGYRLDRNPMTGSAGLNTHVDGAAAARLQPHLRTGAAIDLRTPTSGVYRAAPPRFQRPFQSGLQIGGDPYVSYYDPRTGATIIQQDPLATPVYTPLERPVYIERSPARSLRAIPAGRIDTSIHTRAVWRP